MQCIFLVGLLYSSLHSARQFFTSYRQRRGVVYGSIYGTDPWPTWPIHILLIHLTHDPLTYCLFWSKF